MLFCTSLVALVPSPARNPANSMRRLHLVNTKRQSTICELNFVTTIKWVGMSRRRLVVAVERCVHIYDISNMKVLHTIDCTSNSTLALSPTSKEHGWLAHPANSTTGEVLLFDTLSLQPANIIQAHKSPVTALAFNYDGTLLATASDKGTIIRVYSVPDGKRLYQFRRGSTHARVHHMAFNLQSNMLCVCADTDTIHIFRLASRSTTTTTNTTTTALHNMLVPTTISEILEPVRDFAQIKLLPSPTPPTTQLRPIAALMSSSPQVMVATTDGYLRTFGIDLELGGQCVLLKTFYLGDSPETRVLPHDSSSSLHSSTAPPPPSQ